MTSCRFRISVKANRSRFGDEADHKTLYIGFSVRLKSAKWKKKLATLASCSSKQHQHIHA